MKTPKTTKKTARRDNNSVQVSDWAAELLDRFSGETRLAKKAIIEGLLEWVFAQDKLMRLVVVGALDPNFAADRKLTVDRIIRPAAASEVALSEAAKVAEQGAKILGGHPGKPQSKRGSDQAPPSPGAASA